jgi:mono/diheme cytochrome c family protein
MHTAARFLALLLTFAAVPAVADEAAPSFGKDIQPFLKKHCVACHGAEKQISGVRFDRVER